MGVCNIDLRYVKQWAYIKADKLVTSESSALCASHGQLTDNLSAICGRDRIPWYKGYTPPKDMVIAQHNDLVKGKQFKLCLHAQGKLGSEYRRRFTLSFLSK